MKEKIACMNFDYFFPSSSVKEYTKYCEFIYDRLEADPYSKDKIRRRSYQKYRFNKKEGLKKHENNEYFQTYTSNNQDGGVVRKFGVMPEGFEDSPFIKGVLEKDISHMFKHCSYLFDEKNDFIIGMHPIRYSVTPAFPSFSSPLWLHKDDEKLVYLHFIARDNIVGGQSIVATHNNAVEQVIDLSEFMDTLVLTHDFLHAVTPIGCGKNKASGYRDILLVTFEDEVQRR